MTHTGPRVVILTVVLSVSFLVAAAPASVLGWALAVATNGIATLEGAQGGFWRGHAQALVINDWSGAPHYYERFRWDWHGARLVAGELMFRLQLDSPRLHGSGSAALRWDGVSITDAAFRLPASLIAAYRPEVSPAGLSGELAIQSDGLTFDKSGFGGVARIAWFHAASVMSSVRPLGEYRALVTGMGSHVEFRIRTASGALQVEGRGAWSTKEGLIFDGTARAASDQRELAELLQHFESNSAGGVHRLRIPTPG